MKKTLTGSAAIMAAAVLVSKLVGALYRIPLTNILGAEGIGLYQLIFPVYTLMLTLAGGGTSVAVARLTAERRAAFISPRGIIRSAFFAVFPFAVAGIILMTVFGNAIAGLQGNSAVAKGFMLISPALIITAVSGVLKGWFQGNLNMLPTATSMLLSQITKLIGGLFLATYFLSRGLIYAVYGAVAGVVLAELVSLTFLGVYYLVTAKKEQLIPNQESAVDGIKNIFKIAAPVAIGSILLPLTQFIDSFLIVNLLKSGGINAASATAQYGLFSGTVMSLVNMPVVLILSMSVAVVPAVAAGRATRNFESIVKKSATSIKLSYVVGIPAALLLFTLARPIVELLYPKLSQQEITLAINLLSISALTIVFSSQMQIYTSLLQALDKTYVPVKNLGVAIVIKVILSAVLIYKIGIIGAAVATLAMGMCALGLNMLYLNKLVGKNLKLTENVSQILISGVIITLISALTTQLFSNNIITIAVSLALCITVYIALLAMFKVFNCGELDGIPFSKTLNNLFCKRQ